MTSIGSFAHGTGGILSVDIPNPEPGLEWSYTVPDRTRLQLLYGRASLTCGPQAGNRQIRVSITNTGKIYWISFTAMTLFAGLIQPVDIAAALYGGGAVPGFDAPLNMPPTCILVAGDILASNTIQLRPLDIWTDIHLRFQQWIEA